jgi:hypothetical protein
MLDMVSHSQPEKECAMKMSTELTTTDKPDEVLASDASMNAGHNPTISKNSPANT